MRVKIFKTFSGVEYSWLAFVSSALSILGTVLDRGATNIVLPNISEEFSSDLPTVQWASIVYLLMLATFLLPMGRLSDVIGKKKVIVAGLMIFTAGGILSAISPTFFVLLGGRVMQGIGGAMIQGTSFSIAVGAFGTDQKGRAVGLVLIFVALGNIAGPAVGGLVASVAGWRSVFIFTSVVTAISGLMAAIVLREDENTHIVSDNFDWFGTLMCVLGLGFMLSGIAIESRSEWPLYISFIFIFASLLIMTAFVWWSLRITNPVLDVKLFARPLFTLSIASNLLCFIGMGAALFLLPFYLKYVQGFGPGEIGSVFVPAAACMAIASPLSGRMSDRFGNRYFTVGGLILSTLGLLIMSSLNESSARWLPYLAVVPATVGMGAFYGPNNSATLSQSDERNHGSVIGFINLVRNSGNLISIAVSVTIVATIMGSLGYTADLSSVTYDSDPGLISSFISGIRTSFLILAGLTLTGAVMSFFDDSGKKVGLSALPMR